MKLPLEYPIQSTLKLPIGISSFIFGEAKDKAFISRNFLFSVFLILISGIISLQAQTCNCTQHISKSNAMDYTVNNNQVLCIDSGVVVSGKITIKGGGLCISGSMIGEINDGTSKNSANSFANGGSIIINGNAGLIYSGDFNIGKLKLIVNSRGVLNVTGNLTIPGTGSSLSNNGVINVQGKVILKSGSTLDNKWIMNSSAVENTGVSVIGGGKLNTRGN